MRRLASLGFLAIVTGAVVGLDQWTKSLVRARLDVGESWNPVDWLEPFINVTHWTNTGMAFGQFKSGGQVLTVVGFVVSAIIIWYYWTLPPGQWLVRTALGMQLGGALGNLVDRLSFGTVTDWIEVTHFPLFNVADASISTGVVVLAIVLWREGRRNPPPAKPDAQADSFLSSSRENLPQGND